MALNIAVPWCAVLGFVMVWFLGVGISFLTRNREKLNYRPNLLVSIFRKYAPCPVPEIELKDMEENNTLLVN